MLDFMRIARAVLATVAVSAGFAQGQVQGQPDGNAILREVGEKYAAAKQYELAVTIHVTSRRNAYGAIVREESLQMHMALESPEKVLFEGAGFGEDGTNVYSDGKNAWVYSPSTNTYMAVKPGPAASGPLDEQKLKDDDMIPYALQMASLAMQQLLPSEGASAKILREEKIGDRDCYVIEMHDETTPPEGARLWVDKSRIVILRGEQSLNTAGVTQTTRADYTTARVGEPLPEGLFTFKPPEGAKQVQSLKAP
jgi:outer membrane lipoprotein-sorting protein